MFFKKNDPFARDRQQRTLSDRRKEPTNPFSLQAYRGRRETIRREADRNRHPYTDKYSRRLLLVALLMILLGVADALYTLLHISAGAVEMNPLMDSLLKKGPFIFFGAKFVLTACGVVLLVIYRHYPLARIVMSGVVLVYSVLFCYHMYLFFS